MSFEDKLIENLVFGRSGLNSRVFEKLFISYSCILFIKHCALRSVCNKNAQFFKKLCFFPDFRLIENWNKIVFWKTEHVNAETPQSTLFYEWNAWVWDEKFFKNPWIQPRSSKNKIFNQFLFKAQTLKHILHQNQWTFNLGWPQQVHT